MNPGSALVRGRSLEELEQLTNEELEQLYAENVARWYNDAVLCVREVFGLEVTTKGAAGVVPLDAPDAGERWEPIDDFQRETLEAVSTAHGPGGKIRIVLKASKGPGKTCVLAWILWWFLLTRAHAQVLCAAIDAKNLYANLWKEASVWYQRSLLLQVLYRVVGDRIYCRAHPKTWWAEARAWPKQADKDRQADSLAGFHNDYALVLLDEVGAMPQAVVDTAEGALTTDGQVSKDGLRCESLLVMAGNPTDLEGPLWNACKRFRDQWRVIEINGDPDNPKRARRVSLDYANDLLRKYGRDHPIVRVNVLGDFPLTASDKLLSAEQVDAARARKITLRELEGYPRILGCDIARSLLRNRTVLFPRCGPAAMVPRILRYNDAMLVVHQIVEIIHNWQPHAVFIDGTGLGGPVVDRLRELGYAVIGCNMGDPAANPRYLNMRAQTWWSMAAAVKERLGLPPLPELADGLVTDLTAPKWWLNPRGKIQLEGKDELEDRGLESPDLGDALALTFWQHVPFPGPDDAGLVRSRGAAGSLRPRQSVNEDSIRRRR